MVYTSTRNNTLRLTSSQAILSGLAPDGGLLVPQSLPYIEIEALMGKTYNEVAFTVLRPFLPDFDPEFLKDAISGAYGANFDGKPGHLVKITEDLYSLELWHGPTSAFKDYALQLMPRLFAEAMRMNKETRDILILTATSGDTGSAALAGFAGLSRVKIAAFYPENGTSLLQKLQMTTREEANVAAYGVRGNFDDCQRGVKRIFENAELANVLALRGFALSSANSINWGRLAPQIVYYATSYLALCRQGRIMYGQPLDFCVPTGNFGDIMAGWYAKQIGVPIGRLICASNINNVLADFLNTGRYNINRCFYKTSSPSMDILVSSNLERLLYHITGDTAAVCRWMGELAQNGSYTVPDKLLGTITGTFTAGWADEDEAALEIRDMWQKHAYLSDTHTAVAFKAVREHAFGKKPVVVLSTASPFKFSREVLNALEEPARPNEFDALADLQRYTGAKADANLAALNGKPERFTGIIDADKIDRVIFSMLNLS